MKFPNAARGIKRIFNAEILGLISAALVVIMMIIMLTGLNAGSVSSGALATSGSLLVVCAILGIIGFVLNLMGITDAKKDEDSFRLALYAALGGIAASLVSSFVTGNQMVTDILSVVKSICELMVTYYVLTGVISLSEKVGNSEVAALAAKARTLVCAAFGLSTVLNLVMIFTNSSRATAALFGVIAAVFTIVGYVYYLRVLAKAKDMLN